MGVWGGEGPESVECHLEIALKPERIEPLIEGLEFVPLGQRQHPRRAQPLIGRGVWGRSNVRCGRAPVRCLLTSFSTGWKKLTCKRARA